MLIDFARVYDIHTQARAKLFDWIRPLSQEHYTREFPFAHRTLRATMHEIATHEWWFTVRLREEPMPRPFSWKDLPMNQHATFAELERAWTEQAPQTRATLAGLTDLDKVVETRMYGHKRVRILRATKRDVATQLLLHEVHHRAQAMAMLRHLGLEAQDLDYLHFLQEERVEAISP
ncbi:MAG TPA: DinB family protein [bacterium]|jgi:uncharacterized damage-inducible protein DinB|nr:DinB family protein [bacterium]